MAKVKGPLMSMEALGSIGPITASMGISGPIVKKKALPPQRERNVQPRNRSVLGWLSRQYGILTDVQREAWRDYAIDNPGTNKFGDPFTMSGINAFTMLNHHMVRFLGSAGLMVLPPGVDPVANIWGFAANTGVGVPGDVDLTWTHMGVGLAADFNEIQVAGPFQSQGRVEVFNRFAYNTRVAGNILLATVGGLLEGFWYWFRIRYMDEYGQITTWFYAQATPMLTP